MDFSFLHVLIGLGTAIAVIALVLFTAGDLATGIRRLRLLVRGLCLMVVIVCGFGGIAMLFWGFRTRDEELIYLSLLPIAAALLTSNFMSRNAI